MSSAAICPGLLFATLVVQLAQANGAVVTPLPTVIRRKKGSGECEPGDADCQPASVKTVVSTQTVIMTSLPSNHSSTLTPPSSSITPPPSTPVPSSPATSSPPSDPRLTTNLTKRPSISTGGIIGAVLGSVIILGLCIMLLTKCINRSRKARKRPKGFVQAGSFPPSRPHTPTTEMSQSQLSNRVISSDLVARAMAGPYPHSFATFTTDDSSKTFTSASSNPLLPAVPPSVARSVANSSARRTSLSYTDVSSDGGHPLPSPYDTATLSSWHASQASTYGGAGVSSSLAAAAVAATAASPNASPLHRSMAAFQKALEEESNKASASGANQHDPPPQYDP